jgi:MoaA/NifB/PqqE/SkfB family radical SAM enzyme
MVSLIPKLLEYGIVPRFQAFVNKENVEEMEHIVHLAQQTGLAQHPDFRAFVHAGGCDGANEALYDIRITPEDLEKIPAQLKEWTKQHLGKTVEEFAGARECELYREMLEEDTPIGYDVPGQPVLYIDHAYNVYPNLTAPQPAWCYGNLMEESVETILQRVKTGDTPAMRVMREVPVKELVRACGNADSERLFDRGDYEVFLLNRFTRSSPLR